MTMRKKNKINILLFTAAAFAVLLSLFVTSCPETGNNNPVLVEEIIINIGNITLKTGLSAALSVTVLPEEASNKNVTWSSSKEEVAVINSDGRIEAITKGTTIIVAEAKDGTRKYDFITVTVTDEETETPGSGTEVIEPPQGGINNSGEVTIIESSGWLETLFIKWEKLSQAASYNVYYKGGGISDWIKIDDFLIREYETYFRADIPGLKAGIYETKVLPVSNNGIEGTIPATSSNIEVMAFIRSGFAFKDGAVPGAYKMDGTPKDGARILYITDKNKETVTLGIRRQNAVTETMFTGLQNILTAYESGYESRPLIIRFIGKINEKKGLPFTDSEGSLMIKGNSNVNRPVNIDGMNITLEGIGNDAVAYGWGIRTSRANGVEIRNLGFMLSNTNQKDALEINTNSKNIWVHNCDFFYMRPGSASDQKKGDGSLDIKNSNMITISFNHFWDSGKSSLLGNSASETAGYITYHHNWFNHSDSRHPRTRVHQVHIFNNLYDGIAKYGIGATLGSSIFAERNYFRNTRRPMMISMQGSDITGSSGTFSSENGGMIKAYNNYMDVYSRLEYRPWSISNTIEFDAYEVNNAGQIVPSSVTAKRGGAVYSNFDTIITGYTYLADEPEIAMQNVETWAGRYWRGDFSYTFTESDRNHADDPMPGLLAALNAYTSGLVRIQEE